METDSPASRRQILGLSLAALGVVFGDIGTSPLYTVKECFALGEGLAISPEIVKGVISLIVWTLTIIVSFKYITLVMRANHQGEGGIMALVSLTSLVSDDVKGKKRRRFLILLGVFGACLLYGDGMVTPAISVLSAVEGLKEVKFFGDLLGDQVIIGITIGILFLLFAVQHHGTGKVGKAFGPIMILWFFVIAGIGVYNIATCSPEILFSLSPHYAASFLIHHTDKALPVMGAVLLAVTGSEDLYADMGHFGRVPIRLAWRFLVMPSLILNYLGQGALLLSNPGAIDQPFFKSSPDFFMFPFVILSTVATIIASQALIAGAFSITTQAIQLGFLPRMRIQHTSATQRGQVYIGQVNWFLMVACIGLVVSFKTSGNLAAAYGVAVVMTMFVTSTLFFFLTIGQWKWPIWKAVALCAPFLAFEIIFLGANILKIPHGGWVPLAMAILIFVLMTTWKKGRRLLWEKLANKMIPLETFLSGLKDEKLIRVPGTAFFLSANPAMTPIALLHNYKHNRVLHERLFLLSIINEQTPYVDISRRLEVIKHDEGVYQILGRYGYMESPDLTDLIGRIDRSVLPLSIEECSFFLSRENILPARLSPLGKIRQRIFIILGRNALAPTTFFKIPPSRVVELGMRIEI